MTHTREKGHNCSKCEKSFSQADLKKHHRPHTGEKPYDGAHCEKSFSESGNLKKHKINHHL